jgi:hypothetical protein
MFPLLLETPHAAFNSTTTKKECRVEISEGSSEGPRWVYNGRVEKSRAMGI